MHVIQHFASPKASHRELHPIVILYGPSSMIKITSRSGSSTRRQRACNWRFPPGRAGHGASDLTCVFQSRSPAEISSGFIQPDVTQIWNESRLGKCGPGGHFSWQIWCVEDELHAAVACLRHYFIRKPSSSPAPSGAGRRDEPEEFPGSSARRPR